MDNLQHTWLDKQCISVAKELIYEAIQIKCSFPDYQSLLHYPKISQLIEKLENAVDWMLAVEAGL